MSRLKEEASMDITKTPAERAEALAAQQMANLLTFKAATRKGDFSGL